MPPAKLHRVLMVEDDPPLRELNRLLLERTRKFQVVGEAENGLQALELAKTTRPDVILLDLVMPLMGGVDTLPLLRKQCPKSRIIVISMLQRERVEADVLEKGADAFLDKGLDSEKFVERILALTGPDAAGPNGQRAPGARSRAG
ncbi:MAG: response regulator transcription factor [Euryarchaeota archaeon]|nr:response regulator transcription factor [Euryarchaeota archaeon]